MRIDEPSWITCEPRYHAVFETLSSFLDSASANLADLQVLVKSTLATLQSAGTQQPSVDQYRADFYVLSGILLTIVKSLDAADPEQDFLVELAVAIRNTPLPPTVVETIDEYDIFNEVNLELIPLMRAFNDFEHDAPLYPRLEERPIRGLQPKSERRPWRLHPGNYLDPAEWTNLNAFLARLHVAVPDLLKLDLRGLFALIEALESPLTPTPLKDVVPAAAIWIVIAGKELKNNKIPYATYHGDDGSRRLPWSRGGGGLWTGPRGSYNPERWEF